MYALPIQNISLANSQLNAWFQYSSSQQNRFNRLVDFGFSTAVNYAPGSVRSVFDFHPLSESEEQRWKVLERKAKQENLTGQDSLEHGLLLAVKFYHRLKETEPDLSHMQLLEIVRQSV